jgi:hypothetical protein
VAALICLVLAGLVFAVWSLHDRPNPAATTPAEPLPSEGDADSDDLPNWVEARFGSDPLTRDGDDDGLSDGQELVATTSPTIADTDGDSVRDDRDDTDGDSVSNIDEFTDGTGLSKPDTDDDGLDEGREKKFGSSPLMPDTDGDGLDDLTEFNLGSSPTDADSDGDGVSDGEDSFERSVDLASAGASLSVEGIGTAVDSVELRPPDDLRLADIPGSRGQPVEVVAAAPVTDATLTLSFDPSGLPADAELAVLHFDEATGTFDRPAQQAVDLSAGTAQVTTTDFSPFVVVDVAEFESLWRTEIELPREGGQTTRNLDTALTLDSSQSMQDNDPANDRLTAAKSFVDALLPGDRAAVVDFDDVAVLLQPLTEDRAAAKAAIDLVDSYGNTDIGAGLEAALDELDRDGDPDHGRIVVLLTDGIGYYDPSLTTRAIDTATTVYTVGLGGDTDEILLDDIATRTGGTFFLVQNAADLPGTFNRIGADLGSPDTDGDGLADAAETAGLRDGTGATYVTDPANPDTDGDGLTDGEEAGALQSGGPFGAGTYFPMPSDPTKADTDGDLLDDGDELESGLDPRIADKDADGLDDFTEIDLDFDPLAADGDGDGRRDDRELREGTDPFTYDLGTAEKAHALLGGVIFGDSGRGWVARNIGRLNDAQVSSPWYLAGWLLGGYFAIGDVRDVIYNLGAGNWGDAALSAVGVIPFAGDAVKTGKVVRAFAKLSPQAAPAAVRWIARNIPLDEAIKIVDDFIAAGVKLRNPLDEAVSGRPAPRALRLNRPIGKSATQNARLQQVIMDLVNQGATDIRVNQRQVDINGQVVGINRPDLQYTLGGKRYYREYETSGSDRGPEHVLRIHINDPAGDAAWESVD